MIRRHLLASLSSLLGTTCTGMTIAFTSTLLPQIHSLDNDMGSWIASANILSQQIGVIIGSLLMRKYGRKPCLTLVNIPWLIGWICLSVASNVWVFLIGCSIVGTASGIYGNLAAIYLVEMPEPHVRGFFAALNGVCYAFGIFLQNLIGMSFLWQTALHVSTILPLLTFWAAFYAPESPNWLILNERPDEAKENFFWLRQVSDQSEREFSSLLSSSAEAAGHVNRRITDHILCKPFFRSFFVVTLSMATDVVSGFDSLTMYSVDMIKDMSKDLNPQWATVLTNAFAVISCAMSCMFIEKISRRFMFFFSSLGVLLALLAVVAVLASSLPKSLLIVCLCLYQGFGNVGMLTIPWLLAGEIFPDITRELGIGLSDTCYNVLVLVAVKMNPSLISAIGIEMLFVAYAGLLSICLAILYFVMPETAGYSLQEIEDKFIRRDQ